MSMNLANFSKYLAWGESERLDINPPGIKLTADNVQQYTSCFYRGVDAETTKALVNSGKSQPIVEKLADMHQQGVDVKTLLVGNHDLKQVVELSNSLIINKALEKLDNPAQTQVDIHKLLDSRLSPIQIKYASWLMRKSLDSDEILNTNLSEEQVVKQAQAKLYPGLTEKTNLAEHRDIEAYAKEMLKQGAATQTVGSQQNVQLQQTINTNYQPLLLATPSDNVILNSAAKSILTDYLGKEMHLKNLGLEWAANIQNKDRQSEISDQTKVLRGELQGQAEISRSKLEDSVPSRVSMLEKTKFRTQEANLETIYNKLTHENVNLITMLEYKQIMTKMHSRADSLKLNQELSVKQSRGLKM